MAQLYQTYQPAIQPVFQQGPYGVAWGGGFGEVKDQLMNAMKLGVMARFPNLAPLDALGQIGLERGIFQGPNETTAEYIAQLLNAWGAWTIGGTYWGLLAQLYGSGYTTAYIVATNGYVYGPSNGVTAPDPINGIPGNPPAYQRLPPWYTFGSAPVSSEWSGTTSYALNSIVTPTTQPGTYFLAVQNGTSGSVEPTWPGPNGFVTDGTVKWYYIGNYTSLAYYPPWTFGGGDGQGDDGAPGGVPDPTGAFWSRFIVMFDPLPSGWAAPSYPAWAATTGYSIGDRVTPTSPDGTFFTALNSGTSGGSEPTWPSIGGTVNDGSVTWGYSGDFLANPPTSTSTPGSAEISIIREIIAKWKPGKSACVGIVAGNGPRAMWGWPLTSTTNIPFSSWLSRAILTGDAPTNTAFTAQRPASVYSWLPNTAVANVGGSSYIFTVPSEYYMTQHLGGGYLFSSPASSGTTGFSEPAWPTSLGGTVTDNGITWTCVASLSDFAHGTGSTVFKFQEII